MNGKPCPEASLLGRMGALHSANRPAGLVTGRMVTLPQMEAEERPRATVRRTSKALSSLAASSQTPDASVGETAVSGPLEHRQQTRNLNMRVNYPHHQHSPAKRDRTHQWKVKSKRNLI
ncbi:hypothetical protein AALO_G00116430 [Alosa alosa]|uniref:Uncharacterized protein n=1 Tax=Alosa alosa TaxID=278164 RepID=A0AAV6GUU9_9TELE|nr:hypothetical protein AALO_G00116430 [Alosa alosa]